MLNDFLKTRKPPKESTEMNCITEKMTWNTKDTNLSLYVHKANVDHTISDQGTAISTLDHSATTLRDVHPVTLMLDMYVAAVKENIMKVKRSVAHFLNI